MVSKPRSYSQWGLLEAAGISESTLFAILANSNEAASAVCKPTRGILIELLHFAHDTATTLQRRPNRILKLLVETFPQCKVSRADRLERRIKHYHSQLDSVACEDQNDFLQKEWIPQATGKSTGLVCMHANYHTQTHNTLYYCVCTLYGCYAAAVHDLLLH